MTTNCPCCGEARPPMEWRGLSVSLSNGAWWAGKPLKLFGKQLLAVLYHLVRRSGAIVSRDALILSSLGEEASDNHLSVIVYRLNDRLLRERIPFHIESEYGLGYRLAEGEAA